MKSLEKSILTLLSLGLFAMSIYNVRSNPYAILSTAITLAAAFSMFYINVNSGYSLIQKRAYPSFLRKSALPFLIVYLLALVVNTFYYMSFSDDVSFKPIYLLRAFPHKQSAAIPVLYMLGLLYGYFRINLKALKLTVMAIVMIGAIGLAYVSYMSSKSFDEGSGYQILNNEFQSLSTLIQQPQFKDKTVYIDLWFSSCSPCIDQFQNHLPKLKSQLKTEQKEVVYLYLARETSHPDSKLRWKKAIEQYQLKGWHSYFSKELEAQLWQEITSAPNVNLKDNYGYPHYLIAKNGKIVSYNAPKPEQINELMPLLTP